MKLSLSHWYPGSRVVLDCVDSRPRGYKTSYMLNSAEHKIYPAHNILTFISRSMINTTSERIKAGYFFCLSVI